MPIPLSALFHCGRTFNSEVPSYHTSSAPQRLISLPSPSSLFPYINAEKLDCCGLKHCPQQRDERLLGLKYRSKHQEQASGAISEQQIEKAVPRQGPPIFLYGCRPTKTQANGTPRKPVQQRIRDQSDTERPDHCTQGNFERVGLN